MSGFSKEDEDLLKEFAKESGLHDEEEEEVEVITAPKLKKMIQKYEIGLKKLIEEESKKEKQFIAKKNVAQAKEASEQRKSYQTALTKIPSFLSFEKSKNPNVENVYETLIHEITLLGLDYNEYEREDGPNVGDTEFDDLENEFGDELNELVGFEAPRPVPKAKPVPKPIPKPKVEIDEMQALHEELHGPPVKQVEKQQVPVKPIEVPKVIIPVSTMIQIIENYKNVLKTKVSELDTLAKTHMKNKQNDGTFHSPFLTFRIQENVATETHN
jgi:hypothetical protein